MPDTLPAALHAPETSRPPGRRASTVVAILAWVLVSACTTPSTVPGTAIPPEPPAPPRAAPAAPGPAPAREAAASFPQASGDVVGRNDRVLVYMPGPGDTLRGMATRFLGNGDLAWQIAEANALRGEPVAGQPLTVPLSPRHLLGVTSDAVQTVPVLCYHRFGNGTSKMIVSPARFEAQLEYLARNGYNVVRLDDLRAFMDGDRALPAKSVVITIDDGYESVHRHAFPLLKKYGFPATLFVYSDFIGARDALSWAQLEEMARSGLVDLQAHSKTHRNMAERHPAETDEAYRSSIELELRTPRSVLERRLSDAGVRVRHFAYPYGSANDVVLEAMQRAPYELGVTVAAGGNPFYAAPMLLRRTMIFGDHDMADFQARLQVQRPLARP
jgi:peptidoglycan/xylan/chitin deacetylase (PgdA/CDA1 family)